MNPISTPTAGRLAGPALLVLLAALASCGSPQADEAPETRPPLVEAVAARAGALPIEEVLPGVVRARNQVAIRPEISGRVVEVLARSGDPVRRGQALVRLDDREARERLRAAEADVRLAEAAETAQRARTSELEARVARTRSLAQQKLVSAQDLETLEAQLAAQRAGAGEAAARVEQARAMVEERRTALEKTVVRSPVAGRLGERQVEVGMQVGTGNVLFVAGDLDELIVELDLTEAMLTRVAVDQPVVIDRAGGTPTRATLSRISPFLAEESFTTRGEIDVDNRDGGLRPGMFVTARILVGESERATLVPVSAVWEDPATGRRGVFVVRDAAGLEAMTGTVPAAVADPQEPRRVAFRRVSVRAEGRGAAGVTGLEEGDWVVTVGQHLLAAELRIGASGSEAADEPTTPARVRAVAWERIEGLQELQTEDLLEGFLEKQRKVAAALGAAIPASESEVDRILADGPSAEAPADGGE